MGLCGSKQDNPKNKTYHIQILDEHEGGINCMTLSADGSVLATGSEDRTARLWSTKTPRCECIGILQGHDDYINCVLIEDCYVITGSADKTLRKWEMTTCDCVLVMEGHTSLVNRLICTGDFIFSSSYDRTIRCWDFDTGECIRVFSGHKRGVYPLIFIPAEEEEVSPENFEWDGNKDILISGSADFTARTWSFESGKCLKVLKEHKGAITCMATDPGGKILFTGSTDHHIISWNILKGEKLKVFEGHQASVICLTVVNKLMYTGSSDLTGRSWVTEFGDCTRIFKGHKHTVSCLRFNEGMLYTGSGDGTARVFDAKSATLRRTFTGHEVTINTMQVVDGKLFTGSHDGTLRVWDASGIKDDTNFGKGGDKSSEQGSSSRDTSKYGGQERSSADPKYNNSANGQTNKIMIDDEGGHHGMNGHTNINGMNFGNVRANGSYN